MATKKQQQESPAGEEVVEIRLPLTTELTRPMYVRVNGRTWGVPRGVRYSVPACVAEVIDTSEELKREAIKQTMAMQAAGRQALVQM